MEKFCFCLVAFRSRYGYRSFCAAARADPWPVAWVAADDRSNVLVNAAIFIGPAPRRPPRVTEHPREWWASRTA